MIFRFGSCLHGTSPILHSAYMFYFSIMNGWYTICQHTICKCYNPMDWICFICVQISIPEHRFTFNFLCSVCIFFMLFRNVFKFSSWIRSCPNRYHKQFSSGHLFSFFFFFFFLFILRRFGLWRYRQDIHIHHTHTHRTTF